MKILSIYLSNMSFNTKKTAFMVFNPVQKCKVVAATFLRLTLAGFVLSYLDKFKYLGHIIEKQSFRYF